MDRRPSYSILVASTPDEIAAAQRLRHLVFADEMGAHLHTTVARARRRRVRRPTATTCSSARTGSGEIVGDLPDAAAAAGRDDRPALLRRRVRPRQLAPLRDVLVETGRSCVHPDHRSGAVINLMWTGIARYLHLHGHRWLVGCASVPLADGRRGGHAVWEVVREQAPVAAAAAGHAARSRTRSSRPPTADRRELLAAVPPLLRGYLRLGAWICGEPALDADFGVADFFVLLSLDRVDPRYLKHFLGEDDDRRSDARTRPGRAAAAAACPDPARCRRWPGRCGWLRLVALVAVLLGGVGVALAVPLLGPAGRARATRGWFRAVVRGDRRPAGPSDRRLTRRRSRHAGRREPCVLVGHSGGAGRSSRCGCWPRPTCAAGRSSGCSPRGAAPSSSTGERLRRLPGTVAEIAAALRAGQSVLVFPEGTTWCGRTHGRFYPATLQAAIDAGAAVRPVSLRYRLADGTATTVAAFVGDDTLLASVWRVVGTRGLTVELPRPRRCRPADGSGGTRHRGLRRGQGSPARPHPAPRTIGAMPV